MKFKKTAALLLALLLALALVACGAEPLEIADENGEEDFSLAVLTAADICAKEPRYSCEVFGIGIDEQATGTDDSDKIVAQAQAEFSGVAILQKTSCETEKVSFSVSCERTKGNMRVVLVDEKMNIIHDFAVGESTSFTVENAAGKSYELRIACESAEFNLVLQRSFG